MEYYQFIFEAIPKDKNDILIALLADAGFSGFEEEENKLIACISSNDFDEELFKRIIQLVKAEYSTSIVKEINWNAKWESDFEPVIVLHPESQMPFAIIRANFHQPSAQVMHDIIITPKMSFGTGHHATTYLMIERMSLQSFLNKSVIDFGTGTGVLAILAEKMGAAKIDAIDNDDWSINNAKENIENNNCQKINLYKEETTSTIKKANIILANINLNVIISQLDGIINACEAGAVLLISGILVQDKAIILKALKEKNIKIINCFERNNWLAIETKYSKV